MPAALYFLSTSIQKLSIASMSSVTAVFESGESSEAREVVLLVEVRSEPWWRDLFREVEEFVRGGAVGF